MMKINSRQAAILLAISIFANKILVLPSLLSTYAKGDSVFLVSLIFLFDLLGVGFFLSLKKRYQTQSFFEILSKNIGKWFAYIIFSILLFYFFVKFCLNFKITHSYFKMQVYQEEKIFVFLFAMMVVVWGILKNGLQSFARTAEFFFIPIIFGVVFCQFVSITNFKSLPFFFDTSFELFLRGGFNYLFLFGDFLFLFLIMEKIDYDKTLSKKLFVHSAFAMISICCGYLLFFSIFKNTAFMHINAISDVIDLSYRIFDIGRLDIVAVITVMTLTFLQLGLYGFICSKIILSMFPKLNTTVVTIFILVAFSLVYFMMFSSYDFVLVFISSIMPYFALSLQYILPFSTFLFRRNL